MMIARELVIVRTGATIIEGPRDPDLRVPERGA